MIAPLTRDEHAPDEVRVNGAVRNQDAFHAAFGIVEGDPEYAALILKTFGWLSQVAATAGRRSRLRHCHNFS